MVPTYQKTTKASRLHCLLVKQGTKSEIKDIIWPQDGEKCNFGTNWSFLGLKSLFFRKGAKVVVPIYQKIPRHLVCIVFFVRTWHQMGKKGQYLAHNDQKCIFLGKIWLFSGQKSYCIWEGAKVFVPMYLKTLFALFLVRHSINRAQEATTWSKMSIFG